jgi:DNA (cytosine-5)-methyltransferase 3A
LSIAKKGRQGLEGSRSSLFWEYVRLWELLRPKWFVLENVASMPKADRETITKTLGVEPIQIDASLVSAQSRKRLFWTNLPVSQPADRGIFLKDILEAEVDASFDVDGKTFTPTQSKAETGRKKQSFVQVGYFGPKNHCGVGGQALRVYDVEGKSTTSGVGLYKIGHIGTTDGQANRVYSPEGKSATLSANGGGSGAKTGLYQTQGRIRKLTPVECERLQGLPDGYTEGIAKTQRYKCLGNAFNVDVVAHILSSIRREESEEA